MTFSLHKMLLASVTLIITILTGFVLPAAAEELQSSTLTPVSSVESVEPVTALINTDKTQDIVADEKATVTFERSKVVTSPDPAIEKARLAAIEAEKVAKIEAEKAAEKAAADKKAAEELASKQAAVTASRATDPASDAAPVASSGDTSVGASKAFAQATLASRGMGTGEFQCLNNLWEKESNWNYKADNPSSDAFGIPQSLPGSKMASIAPDWQTNPQTQILWGLSYIEDRYGSPCNAWGHSQSVGWY